MEVVQNKPKEVNQEIIQLKNVSKAKRSTNEEPLREHIIEAYLEELQLANLENNDHLFRPIRSKNLIVTKRNCRKRELKKQSDKPEAQPHVIPEVKNQQKLTSAWKEPVRTSIIPCKAPIESTM